MQLSVSYLSVKDDLKKSIEQLNNTTCDYIHLDIMDSLFVPNETMSFEEAKTLFLNNSKLLDVHLMVSDIYAYVDNYKTLNPQYITFHYEASANIFKVIEYIKKQNIKVGISIKPNTNIEVLKPYLHLIDLVLLMSVEPGMGGQAFITKTETKINDLIKLKEDNDYKFVIEVDGGINQDTIKYCQKADIVVVGNFITKEDNYQEQINKLKL